MVDLPIPIDPVSPICIGFMRAVDKLEAIKTINDEALSRLLLSRDRDIGLMRLSCITKKTFVVVVDFCNCV